MFTFGLPPDPVAWAAFVLAFIALFVPRMHPGKRALPWLLGAIALLATLLSVGYLHYYLGGQPRVIDATAYLLEAKSIALGGFSFEVPSPTASFRGRFLIHTAHDDHSLGVIFPPGYPTLLALGVLLNAELWVGPVLSALLVLSTYGLTQSVVRRSSPALLAATLSALCACLRYHTADTMSHGWAALLATWALWATVELQRVDAQPASRKDTGKGDSPRDRWWLWCAALGGSLGLLISTRQLTGLCFLLVAAFSLISAHLGVLSTKRRKLWAGASLAAATAIPGCVLLLAHHQALTGSLWVSPQSRYYDLADGPGACFGWGLGYGCGYEHADVVAQQGGEGLTPVWALLNTVHRLHWHALDVVNFEPLVLVGVFVAWKARRNLAFRPLIVALLVVPATYSLFYFNGSYPGAGARFFSELLPAWHALIAIGLSALGWQRAAVFAPLLGFALHGVFSHQALSSTHFGPQQSGLVQLTRALPPRETGASFATGTRRKDYVLFSSAHEFNLASLSDPSFTAARWTDDDRPSLLLQGSAEDSAWRYLGHAPGEKLLSLIAPTPPSLPLNLESEFDFPPLAAHAAWVHPEAVPLGCVSRGRALRVHVEEEGAQLTLEIPPHVPRPYDVELHWVEATQTCRRTRWPMRGNRQPAGRLLIDLGPLKGITHIDRLELRSSASDEQ